MVLLNKACALIQLLVSMGFSLWLVIDGILGDEARAIQFLYYRQINHLQRIKPTAEQVA